MTGNDMPLARIWLLGRFVAKRCKADGTEEAVPKVVWATTYARPLLKRLLCAAGRRAGRSDLLDDLWPNNGCDDFSEEEEDREKRREKYLSDAASKLRQVFGKEIIRPLGSHGAVGYELAGPSDVWTDVEECQRLMAEAERRGLSSAEALPLLERAGEYFKRGAMLEGEDGEWCLAFRAQQEEAMRNCLLSLAEAYEARTWFWQARKQCEWLLEINPIDEETLSYLLSMLHRHGLLESLRSAYEAAQKRFEKYDLPLSQTTKELFEHLIKTPIPFSFYTSSPGERSRPLESETRQQPDPSLAQASPIAYNVSSQLLTLPFLEMLEMLMLQRREFFNTLLNSTVSAVIISPYTLLSQESQAHIERAMTHPSYLDDKAVDHLAAVTQNFWDLREKKAASDLLDGIVGHFLTITTFLKESRPTPISKRLCALASEQAQLLGRTFDEIREFNLAWKSYAFALQMAQEINHTDLWAGGAVRLAELLYEWGEPLEALPFLHEARKRGIYDPRLRVWVSSVEAKIHAMTGNMEKFLKSLEQSKNITLPESLTDDIYQTDFTPKTVTGYEGVCLMWLHESERALPLLNGMLAKYDPTSIRPRALRLAEIGRVHGQLGDVKKACEQLRESLGITAQTKSLVTLQRIYQGRAELDPWKNSGDVKELDARIVEVYNSLVRVKERV